MYVGSEIGQGYPGDEDNGESSAWWLFAALGFYPLRMGSGDLVIGSPLFAKATVHLENGRTLTIRAPGNTADTRYVDAVTVNGKPWNSTAIPHHLLAEGGDIAFAMSTTPGRWGRDAAALPPSLTRGDAIPVPLADLSDRHAAEANAGKAGDLFDDDSRTEVVFAAPLTVTVALGKAAHGGVRMYTLTSGGTGGHPTAWTLEGSDDGAHWTRVDKRSGERFEWARYTRPFAIRAPAAYRRYRLVIAAASDARQSSLAEIELLGTP